MVRVFNHWFSPRKAAYFLAEEAVLVVALLAGASLGPVAAQGGAVATPVAPAIARAALASLFFAGALYLGDLYDLHAAVRDRADGRRLLRALGVATIALALADLALSLFLPGWMLHRSLVLAATGGAFGVIAARALMPAVVGSPTRVLFLGAGPRAHDLARAVEREADGLWEVVGFVVPAEDRGPTAVPESLVRRGAVEEIAQRLRAHTIVVAMEDRRQGLPLESLLAIRTRGGRVLDDVSFAEAALQRLPLSLVRPSALIFEEGFRVSRATRTAKRLTDVAIALLLLVLLAPVMVVVALVVLLADGRPILYAQERTGQGGRTYRIRKFRTMRRDAELRGAAWAVDRDPRVLRVGRFLRRGAARRAAPALERAPRRHEPRRAAARARRLPARARGALPALPPASAREAGPLRVGAAPLRLRVDRRGAGTEARVRPLLHQEHLAVPRPRLPARDGEGRPAREGCAMRTLEDAVLSRFAPAAALRPIRVVAAGGGTGLPRVLAGLAAGVEPDEDRQVDVTAIVTTADDGGSSGALRRAYGVPAAGDVRNCLVALAAGANPLAVVFQHRFEGEGGLAGHTVGNLVLTALAQRLGSFEEAVGAAAALLGVRGRVLPASEGPVELVARLEDGRIVRGETRIARAGGRVAELRLARPVAAPRAALEAVLGADVVVLGPGSLYSSVLASLLARGMPEALRTTAATRVLAVNLLTQPGETDGLTAADHVRAVQHHLGDVVDVALVHRGGLPPDVAAAHAAEGAHPVEIDRAELESLGVVPVVLDLLAAGDVARHDPDKLARALLGIARAR